MQAGGQRGEQVGKRGNVRASQPKSAVAEKVGFALAVRQPRPQTNFSILRQNDCAYTYETYYNTCLHTHQSG